MITLKLSQFQFIGFWGFGDPWTARTSRLPAAAAAQMELAPKIRGEFSAPTKPEEKL
jgi:hypothetical protein